MAKTTWTGGELRNVTESLYGVRELALSRLTESARAYGAEGVVGIRIEQNQDIWGRRALEMSAVGTAQVRHQRTRTAGTVEMVLPIAQ